MSLRRLSGCAYLSGAQERHLNRAARHVHAAVVTWLDEVTGEEERRTAEEPKEFDQLRCSGYPECPRRDIDHVTTMLDIYRHDFSEREFTPMQLHFLMVAIHNLANISGEIMKRAK